MPGAARVGDKAQAQGQGDAHGCPGCPHPTVGPAIIGSTNVNINDLPAVREGDVGVHAACCGPNMWTAKKGAPHVFINGKAAMRQNDPTTHCGGSGKLVGGSGSVIIGDGGGGGGGGSGASSSLTASASSSSSSGSSASSASSSRSSPSSQAASSASPAPAAAGGSSPAATPAEQPDSWIEIELCDQDGDPIADEPYEIVASDGKKRTGMLNRQGKARENWLAAGDCKVSFPHLKGWKPS